MNEKVRQSCVNYVRLGSAEKATDCRLLTRQILNSLPNSTPTISELTSYVRLNTNDATSALSFQIESLEKEKKRLKADLEEAYKRHKEELEIQQLQHFQVRRTHSY